MKNPNLKNKIIPFIITAFIVLISFLLFGDMEIYFSHLLHSVINHPIIYALISFLVLASDIVLPVPSSIVMYFNGYVLGVTGGSAISLISLLTSSVAGYFLGKLTSLGLKAKMEISSGNAISKYGTLTILITRGIPIISESICIVCGYNKIPFRQYFILNLIGYIPLCFLYAFCGSIGYGQNTFLLSFGCSVLISALFLFFGKMFLKKPLPNPKPERIS